ncbi:MAG TPA: hypothetical protein VFV50_12590 [Bdellovibrionales bacterium]|nr:hypothetical protein [Bdellovibrionales bacterium]
MECLAEADQSRSGWSLWKTCLRQIAFGHSGLQLPGDIEAEVYTGEAAYSFCLEVVCGLKSPLAGETEVMGQFREHIAGFQGPPAIKKLLETVLADAKAIRHKHLTKLGSQSYGSLSRKLLQEYRELHVLGAGQLTEELLPWLSDKETVFVYGRSPEKRKKLESEFSHVRVRALTDEYGQEANRAAALVIAAPMKAEEIRRWVAGRGFGTVLDLRGESRHDPLTGISQVVSLKDFYQSLESHQAQVKEKVDAARSEIERVSREKTRLAELRPFGWDDLCA